MTQQHLSSALIAFGSNQKSDWGDVQATVQKAMSLVRQMSQMDYKESYFYQTPAFPVGAGSDYCNATSQIKTQLSAPDLMAALHKIEVAAHRVRTTRWASRTLDIDLIFYDNLILPDLEIYNQWRNLASDQQMQTTPDQLILPHPRMQDRSFVLRPLADIAPDWPHPVTGQTIREMLAARPTTEQQEITRMT